MLKGQALQRADILESPHSEGVVLLALHEEALEDSNGRFKDNPAEGVGSSESFQTFQNL